MPDKLVDKEVALRKGAMPDYAKDVQYFLFPGTNIPEYAIANLGDERGIWLLKWGEDYKQWYTFCKLET